MATVDYRVGLSSVEQSAQCLCEPHNNWASRGSVFMCLWQRCFTQPRRPRNCAPEPVRHPSEARSVSRVWIEPASRSLHLSCRRQILDLWGRSCRLKSCPRSGHLARFAWPRGRSIGNTSTASHPGAAGNLPSRKYRGEEPITVARRVPRRPITNRTCPPDNLSHVRYAI